MGGPYCEMKKKKIQKLESTWMHRTQHHMGISKHIYGALVANYLAIHLHGFSTVEDTANI